MASSRIPSTGSSCWLIHSAASRRSRRTFACVTSAFYGPKIFYTDDLGAEWEQAAGVELPEDAEKPLERLWTIVPAEDDDHLYAGGAPGVLFESHDSGASWALNQSFWEQPTRPEEEDKARALRSAALELMKGSRYRHPYYWAGFVLVGASE